MKKLVLCLALVSVGSFAMAQQTEKKHDAKTEQERKEMMEKRKAAHLEEMQKELNLSTSQVAQIKELQAKHHAEREVQRKENQELKQQKMEAFKKDKQVMDNEMRQILTPEQYAKWEAKRAEKMKDSKDRMQRHKMNKDKGEIKATPITK